MKRIMLSTALTGALLATGFTFAGPAQALSATTGAPATGDVLGVFSPASDCSGLPDGVFDDVFLLDPPGTTDANPIPAGAQCLTVTNLSDAPIQVVLSGAPTGSTARRSPANYRCGGLPDAAAVDVAPGQTTTFDHVEICVRADIDIL